MPAAVAVAAAATTRTTTTRPTTRRRRRGRSAGQPKPVAKRRGCRAAPGRRHAPGARRRQSQGRDVSLSRRQGAHGLDGDLRVARRGEEGVRATQEDARRRGLQGAERARRRRLRRGSRHRPRRTRCRGRAACTCAAARRGRTRAQPIDARTCKHLRAYLGDDAETARVGNARRSASAATIKKDTAAAEGKAPPLLLAHKWESDRRSDRLVDEREARRHPRVLGRRAFISRLGNKFYAPDWFVADLPADTLDGELWVGRKQFQSTTSIVRSGAGSADWKTVTYVVFDAPEANGGVRRAARAHREGHDARRRRRTRGCSSTRVRGHRASARRSSRASRRSAAKA